MIKGKRKKLKKLEKKVNGLLKEFQKNLPFHEKLWKKTVKEVLTLVQIESADFTVKIPSETPAEWIRRKSKEYLKRRIFERLRKKNDWFAKGIAKIK